MESFTEVFNQQFYMFSNNCTCLFSDSTTLAYILRNAVWSIDCVNHYFIAKAIHLLTTLWRNWPGSGVFFCFVIFCFERRFSTQNSVIRLKSNILAPKIFGLATPLTPS